MIGVAVVSDTVMQVNFGRDTFFNTFKYHHWITLYETMTDYLKHDCGPRGL